MKLTTVTKINKELKSKLVCQIYGKADVKIKARGLFQYMGFNFFTAKEGKNWFCYEFTSGCLSVQFKYSEEEVIKETKYKIDTYCKNKAAFRRLVRTNILKDGFPTHAKYSNLLPKEIQLVA